MARKKLPRVPVDDARTIGALNRIGFTSPLPARCDERARERPADPARARRTATPDDLLLAPGDRGPRHLHDPRRDGELGPPGLVRGRRELGDRLRRLRDGRLTDVFGGERDSVSFRRPQHGGDSLGNLYYFVTEATGFKPLRHEGKVLGLAAFGEPVHAEAMKANYRLMPNGEIRAVKGMKDIARQIHALAKATKKEDMAASAQKTLEDLTIASLARALDANPAKNLGVAGGVFARCAREIATALRASR